MLECIRPERAHELLMGLNRPGQQRVILAGNPAHAMDQDVDLGNERLDQRASSGGNAGQQRAQSRAGRLILGQGKFRHDLLPALTVLLHDAGMLFDLAAKP
jgi:hypothetical protein